MKTPLNKETHLHMDCPEAFSFVDKGPLLSFAELFPVLAKPFGDLGVVHFRILLCHFSSLTSGPNHKSTEILIIYNGKMYIQK